MIEVPDDLGPDGFVARAALRPTLVDRRDRARSSPVATREFERRTVDDALARLEALDRATAERFLRERSQLDVFATFRRLSAHPLDDSPHYGDEPLDAFLELLLGTDGRYDGGASPGAEMIHYDPSPASAALVLAARGWFDAGETFVDLGSGTGRVVTLASWLGPARAVGVEIDAPLVAIHRLAAERLGLPFDVRIGDARTARLDDGTGFFFFAPFVGSVLADVLERLRGIAHERPIRVGSWGPSTAAIAAADFLVPDREAPYGPFDLATFRAGPS